MTDSYDTPESAPLFGLRAIQKGYVTRDQILVALRLQYNAKVLVKKHLFIGEVLIMQGVLGPEQLQELLEETGAMHEEAEDLHGGRFFGDVAVMLGFCTPEHVFEALTTQFEDDNRGDRHRLIGEILFDAEHLDEDQVRKVVEALVDRVQTAPEGLDNAP